jgi:methionyl aminopeptidase
MIICRSKAELALLYQSNQLVAELLVELAEKVKSGVSTWELEEFAERWIKRAGGEPTFKGYHGYPATLCTSVNDGIVHGIPSRSVVLKEGDILSIDVGITKNGYVGDSALTVPVGRISRDLQRLLNVTQQALYVGIEQVRIGNRVSDISVAIQQHVESHGYSVVREFVGHGVGTSMHEDPQVPNFGRPGTGAKLLEGMVLAIEPMVNTGGPEVKLLADKWTAVTADGGYSAHFEHSVAVSKDGPWILSDLAKKSARGAVADQGISQAC